MKERHLNLNKMKRNIKSLAGYTMGVTDGENDQYSQQTSNNSIQQSTQQTSDSDPDKINIEVEEIQEWDVEVTDQRRPQFRYSENYGRKNYLM